MPGFTLMARFHTAIVIALAMSLLLNVFPYGDSLLNYTGIAITKKWVQLAEVRLLILKIMYYFNNYIFQFQGNLVGAPG